ncbi:MAG: alanine racemase C-terminal domain-containing protein, partial [Anaerolineaceae bacterium]
RSGDERVEEVAKLVGGILQPEDIALGVIELIEDDSRAGATMRVPVRGGVCMDQCMIALDNVPEAKIGDEVVLIGRQGNSRISAEEVGAEWSTINYEVVCGLANRVPRFYPD